MIRLFGLVITTTRRYDREQVKAWDLGRACGRLGIMVEQGLLSEADLAAIERAAERDRELERPKAAERKTQGQVRGGRARQGSASRSRDREAER